MGYLPAPCAHLWFSLRFLRPHVGHLFFLAHLGHGTLTFMPTTLPDFSLRC
jgi:hypothetical protein